VVLFHPGLIFHSFVINWKGFSTGDVKMADRAGQRLDDYRLIRLLGEGASGEVYLGEHITHRIPVAIKVLKVHLTPDTLKDFLTEARTIRLKHPHIIQILDFGIESNIPFLVMDYAPNGTLRQRHPPRTRLSLESILPYIKQVADALQYAHDQRLIHRDVKPQNMLLGRNNEVLLSDFGIAVVAHSERSVSKQVMAGTFPYMAPEQLQGKPRPASDQYALGIAVYEWLCGARPFQGSEWEIANQHLFVPPLPLREKIPSIPATVESVVLKALAKDPQERFASVQMFANELEQACQWEPPILAAPRPDPLPLLLSEQSRVQPSLPPQTQKPGIPPPQKAVLSSSENHPTTAEPITVLPSQKPAIPIGKHEKVNIWRISKRQVVASIIGSVLYGVLISINDYIAFSRQAQHISNTNDPINSTLGILMGLTILLFGAVFGPWVGLLTAELGSIMAYIYTSNIAATYNIHLSWDFGLGGALIGFITGLATLVPQGRSNQISTFAITEGFSILGIITGVGLYILLESLFYHNIASPLAQFLASVQFYLPSLVFLPILLVAYNFVVRRRGGA
jgi:serine/threonine protein kinase